MPSSEQSDIFLREKSIENSRELFTRMDLEQSHSVKSISDFIGTSSSPYIVPKSSNKPIPSSTNQSFGSFQENHVPAPNHQKFRHMIVSNAKGEIVKGELNVNDQTWDHVEGIVAMNELLRKMSMKDSDIVIHFQGKRCNILSFSSHPDWVVLEKTGRHLQKNEFIKRAREVIEIL